MRCGDGVFPSSNLGGAFVGQTVEHLFLKKVVDGHLTSVHRFKEPEELEPVPVFGKGVVSATSNRLLSYLNTLFINSVEVSPQCIEDVRRTRLTVLNQILLDEEPWPVF